MAVAFIVAYLVTCTSRSGTKTTHTQKDAQRKARFEPVRLMPPDHAARALKQALTKACTRAPTTACTGVAALRCAGRERDLDVVPFGVFEVVRQVRRVRWPERHLTHTRRMSVPVPARPSGTPPFPDPHPLQLCVCACAAHARACECAVLRATASRQRAKPSTTDSALSSGTPPHDSLPFPPLSTSASSGQHTGPQAKVEMEFRSLSFDLQPSFEEEDLDLPQK